MGGSLTAVMSRSSADWNARDFGDLKGFPATLLALGRHQVRRTQQLHSWPLCIFGNQDALEPLSRSPRFRGTDSSNGMDMRDIFGLGPRMLDRLAEGPEG